MKVGSLVETVGYFEDVRKEWGLDYPRKGDLLIVAAITEHPIAAVRKKGIVCLHFEEKPTLPGICDKTIKGELNFREVQPPMEVNINFEENYEVIK